MKKSKDGASLESASSAETGEQEYLDLHFEDDEVDESESERPKLPYGIRHTDGAVRVVRKGREDPLLTTVEAAGRHYRGRQLERHLLFRDLYSPPAGDMCFLPDTTAAEFAATLQRRAPGRSILLDVACGYFDYGQFYYLCFDIDGTGFAMHTEPGHDQKRKLRLVEWERVDFRWDDFPGLDAALTAPVEDLRESCNNLFTERINLQLRAPALGFEDLPRIPLTWQGGSEEDFQRLTRAICMTEPGLFEAEGPFVALYRATSEWRRGGFVYVERGDSYEGDHYISRRLMALGDLIFRLNPCIGTDWFDRSSSYTSHRQLQKSALRVKVEIEPPSAHEKAEAYLDLLDWLEDKLHDPEKRARFGLAPRTGE